MQIEILPDGDRRSLGNSWLRERDTAAATETGATVSIYSTVMTDGSRPFQVFTSKPAAKPALVQKRKSQTRM